MWDRTFAEQAFQQQIIHYTTIFEFYSFYDNQLRDQSQGNLFHKPNCGSLCCSLCCFVKPCPWCNHAPRLPVWGVLLGELGQLVLHGHSALAAPSVQLGPARSSSVQPSSLRSHTAGRLGSLPCLLQASETQQPNAMAKTKRKDLSVASQTQLEGAAKTIALKRLPTSTSDSLLKWLM